MNARILIIIILCLGFLRTMGQEKWTLKNCIDYAIENNISLEQKENNLKISKVNLFESKMDLLPSIYAGTNISLNYGRNIDDSNNVTFDETMGQNYGISASINIFNGLVGLNKITFQKYMYAASEFGVEVQKNQLINDILSAYYTLYYSIGLAESAKKQTQLAESLLKRMEKLVEVGKESPITAQELKSQLASDKLILVKAENTVRDKELELKHLLRFDANKPLNIDTVLLASYDENNFKAVDSVYERAFNVLPEIKQQENLLKASEKDLAISRGYISPRFYLQAGYGTDYFNGNPTAYSTQLKNNQSQWISIGVNIPIFDGASTYSSIKRGKINLLNQKLTYEKQKDELYSKIYQAVNDLQSSYNEYESALELNKLSKLTLDNTVKKLDKGLASTTDYESAKQRFISSEAGLLKSKLIYMMRNQTLEFYLTGSWEHL